MKHYRIFSFILLFICAAFGQSCSISSSGREVLDMNTDWAFYRGDVVEGSRTDLDDSGWIPVALPHIMQLEMKHCGGNSIYDGIGWGWRVLVPAVISNCLQNIRINGSSSPLKE